MPNWKKVITSGSNAHLNHITASGNISSSGQLFMNDAKFGTDSVTIDGPGGHITASGDISASGTITAEHFVSSDDAFIADTLTVNGFITLPTAIGVNSAQEYINFGSPNKIQTYINNTPRLVVDDFGIEVSGNITSSGNISSSETIIANSVDINGSTQFGDIKTNIHKFTGSLQLLIFPIIQK